MMIRTSYIYRRHVGARDRTVSWRMAGIVYWSKNSCIADQFVLGY